MFTQFVIEVHRLIFSFLFFFSFAGMEMNRMALLQDFENTDTVASIVEDIKFLEENERDNDLDKVSQLDCFRINNFGSFC